MVEAGKRRAERDVVAKRAADDGLDVGDGRDVGEVAERQLVGARAEVDRGVGRELRRA